MTKKVLTIAGSDCSGGAGIQADIKTITAHKMYAMSVITALTAQNTQKVAAVLEASPEFVALQMDAVFTDIFPDAVKVGMVSNAEIIRVIAAKLREYAPKHIVVDPVMVSASGYKLLSDEARDALATELMPLGELATPNIPEAEVLCGVKLNTVEDMERAATEISRAIGGAVLLKGGHMALGADKDAREGGELTDVLCDKSGIRRFVSRRVANPNTHGTGCTLSSAIACGLAAGLSLDESIGAAKAYLTDALAAMLDLGVGSGPLDHACWISAAVVSGVAKETA